jgi:predicted ATPase
MDSEIRRRRTFAALKKVFLRESLNQPLLLIFEDLHWIDDETQGFLDVLSESAASARILLLTSYRPEYRHDWGNKTYYTQLRLTPLGKEEREEFLAALLAKERVEAQQAVSLPALKQLIVEKTEGNPFFIEEIVQELWEQGVLSSDLNVGTRRVLSLPSELHIPTTVQGVLAARIDRLAAEEKALLQQLAVIGREFPLGLVRQVVPQSEGELFRLLAALQRKEFLYEQPAFPEVEYLFKHALTQEVAYNTVLQERRKTLHERTAQAIEALYGTTLEDHYGDLAYHYSCSGNIPKAVAYLYLAGQQAVQRSAYTEAINHLTTALELIKTLPDMPERLQQELALQLTLGAALITTKGYGVLAVEQAYARALELCRQLGETPQLFPALLGLSLFYMVRAEYTRARELGEQCLTLAQRSQDPALLIDSHVLLGEILYLRGELTLAQAHLEQGIALYDPQQPRRPYGIDLGVFCCGWIAQVLWLLGYADQAAQKSQEALTLSQEQSHPFSVAFALNVAATLHQSRWERQLTQERAAAAITLSTERGFPTWLANTTVLHGWALATQGQGEAGIAQIRRGLAAHQAAGEEIGRSVFLGLLAEACEKVGQLEEGLTVLNEALDFVDKTGERYYEAELWWLKGELLLMPEDYGLSAVGYREKTEEAEGCFLKAIEIARKQSAKSLELRAVMSLSRLWQQRGSKEEARQLLADVYNWFTEGFDTKDLREAKVLLEELTG